MIKIDLVTGFLGAGKTTFIRKYVEYLNHKGIKVGILENDHGAVNVDMLILNDMRGDLCELEMVAGGCDSDCHRRRFKTKLISMAMSGYDRVIVEPSGVFDIDEFFDVIRDEPLDERYVIDNVFCIVDAKAERELSEGAAFLLASQAACAGKIILSHVEGDLQNVDEYLVFLQKALDEVNCKRQLSVDDLVVKDWNLLSESDFETIAKTSYVNYNYVKKYTVDNSPFETLYYLELPYNSDELKARIKSVFATDDAGSIFRIKGYVRDDKGWQELNYTSNSYGERETNVGQDVLIIIGERLNKERINTIMGAVTAEQM